MIVEVNRGAVVVARPADAAVVAGGCLGRRARLVRPDPGRA